MLDTQYKTADKKKIIILFRAIKHYPSSTIESTVKFLSPKIPDDSPEREIYHEWYHQARPWFEKLAEAEKDRLEEIYETVLESI